MDDCKHKWTRLNNISKDVDYAEYSCVKCRRTFTCKACDGKTVDENVSSNRKET